MANRKLQSERELEDYEREKQEAQAHIEGRASSRKDPNWDRARHEDSLRGPTRTSDAAKDARGQSRRGRIDQERTDRGHSSGD